MAKKKEVYKVKPLNENKRNIISALIDEYDIETAEDIQEALKDLLGGTIKSKWMSIWGMTAMSAVTLQTTETEQNPKRYAVPTGNLKLMYRRTDQAPLNHRL